MPTDLDLLTLAQWLSPAYPVGAFAYSHGLEWAAGSGAVTDAPTLRDWLADVLHHGAGRSDLLFLAAAHRADAAEIPRIDVECRAFATSRERRLELDRQGTAFSATTAAVWGHDLPPLAYPVAVGRAAALQRLPLVPTAQLFLHAFLSNLVSAAQRLMPLGQTEAQRILRDLAPPCLDAAEAAANGTLEDLSATAFLGDIAAMRHETQATRIFRT
jgi:urease accessory protein